MQKLIQVHPTQDQEATDKCLPNDKKTNQKIYEKLPNVTSIQHKERASYGFLVKDKLNICIS
jgi:hypothetical protein